LSKCTVLYAYKYKILSSRVVYLSHVKFARDTTVRFFACWQFFKQFIFHTYNQTVSSHYWNFWHSRKFLPSVGPTNVRFSRISDLAMFSTTCILA